MRPSKIAAAGVAGIGAERIGGAGHAQHRSRHRIEHALAMRVRHRDAVRIDRRLRLDREFLDGAVGEHHADGFGLLRRRGGGVVIGRDQRAVDDAALRRPRSGTAGERLQQARRAAEGGGGERVVGYVDGPGAAADGNAGQRRLILRVEPALREHRLGRPGQPARRPRPGHPAPAATIWPAGANACGWWSRKGGPLGGAIDVSFKSKNPANNAYSEKGSSSNLQAPSILQVSSIL